jgi:hypothetical protein
MNSFRPLFPRIIYLRSPIPNHRDPGIVKLRDDFEIEPARTRQVPVCHHGFELRSVPGVPAIRIERIRGMAPYLRNVRPGNPVTVTSAGMPPTITGAPALENADLIQGYKYIRRVTGSVDPGKQIRRKIHIAGQCGLYICNMEVMNSRRARRVCTIAAALCSVALVSAQVIEYEVNGVKYQTLSRQGLTVIFTRMPNHVANFGLVQVSISNGSDRYWVVQPEEFSYVKPDASSTGISAGQVVDVLLDKGSHSDVVKLVTSYENTLYAIPNMRSTNGYEQRRRNSLNEGINAKLKAAATASAIALAQTRLAPGQSTDGSVFIPLTRDLKTLTGGHLVFRADGETFDFNPD